MYCFNKIYADLLLLDNFLPVLLDRKCVFVQNNIFSEAFSPTFLSLSARISCCVVNFVIQNPEIVSIGNSMVSSAIGKKHARVSFSKTFPKFFNGKNECKN